jgi:hypothetical protein
VLFRSAQAPLARTSLFVFPWGQQRLTNGSFEANAKGKPQGWTFWADTSGGKGSPLIAYRSTKQKQKEVVHGSQSLQLTTVYSIHRAGFYQQVQLSQDKIGCQATFSISALTWDKQKPDWTPQQCGFGSFQVKAGIDASGGTNPQAKGVVWTDSWKACPDFQRLSIRQKISQTKLTLFFLSAPKWPVRENVSIWDLATLTVDCP